MAEILEHEGVKRVRAALVAAGHEDAVRALAESAATAEAAAKALGCPLGAIVKSLVFLVGDRFVLALIAGDRKCVPESLAPALQIKGAARKAEAGEVRFATGFVIGGVAPVGLARPLPVVMDRSLKRFDIIYAAAGHPFAVFATAPDRLKALTGAIVSYNLTGELETPPAKPAADQRDASTRFAPGT